MKIQFLDNLGITNYAGASFILALIIMFIVSMVYLSIIEGKEVK